MSPESRLEEAAAKVSADLAKVKSVWASHEIWIVAAACLLLGATIGHLI